VPRRLHREVIASSSVIPATAAEYRYSGTGGNPSYVHAYKEINVPANQPYLTISFKAKLNGGGFHRAIFYLMPSTMPLPQADAEISRAVPAI
jgi:hypothetical protein